MSTLWRAYGGARLRNTIFDWQEETYGELPFKGCRTKAAGADLLWAFALAPEQEDALEAEQEEARMEELRADPDAVQEELRMILFKIKSM